MLHYAQHARAVPPMPDSSNLRPLNSSPTPNLCLHILLGRTHKEGSPLSLGSQGDPGRARTSDLQIRNLSLYPLSYGIVNYLLDLHQITPKVVFPQLSAAQSSTIYCFMPCIINHGSTLVNPELALQL